MRLSSPGRRWLLCALVAAVLASPALLSRAQAGSGGGSVLRVTERDFRISAPRTVKSGRVELKVHNTGPDTHELLIVRTPTARLPLRRDGLTVDEDRLKPLHPVSIEGMERGKGDKVRVVLAPGRYVLFCNMAGHYLSGMHRTLVVR